MRSLPLLGAPSAPSVSVHRPVFAKGFRPFFLVGAAFAALVVPLWLLVMTGRLAVSAYFDPVSARDYMRFLLRWQHVAPGTQLQGRNALRHIVGRLEGFEAPAVAWESELLAARIADYTPAWLDELCLAGEAAWARLTPRKAAQSGSTGSTLAASRIRVAATSGTNVRAVADRPRRALPRPRPRRLPPAGASAPRAAPAAAPAPSSGR